MLDFLQIKKKIGILFIFVCCTNNFRDVCPDLPNSFSI